VCVLHQIPKCCYAIYSCTSSWGLSSKRYYRQDHFKISRQCNAVAVLNEVIPLCYLDIYFYYNIFSSTQLTSLVVLTKIYCNESSGSCLLCIAIYWTHFIYLVYKGYLYSAQLPELRRALHSGK